MRKRYQILAAAGAGLALYLRYPVFGGIIVLASACIGTFVSLLHAIYIACKESRNELEECGFEAIK